MVTWLLPLVRGARGREGGGGVVPQRAGPAAGAGLGHCGVQGLTAGGCSMLTRCREMTRVVTMTRMAMTKVLAMMLASVVAMVLAMMVASPGQSPV